MKNKKLYKLLLSLLFIVYLVLLVLIVLLKFDGSFNYIKSIRQSLLNSGQLNINLVLFNTINPYLSIFWKSFAFKNIVGNIVAFIPLGYFMSILVYKKKFIKTMWNSIAIVLLIESIQLVTKIGFFDVDDLLLNSIGIFLGYIISLFFKKV